MSKPTLNLDVYNRLLVDWGKEKGILFPSGNANEEETITKQDLVVIKQALKLQEEVGELAGSIVRGKAVNIRDALGDIFTVWSMLCHATDNNPNEVVQEVYDIISKRTGTMKDSAFIKAEDQ